MQRLIDTIGVDYLEVYYPMNEPSGTVAYDYSRNRRNGTYSGTPTLAQTGIGDGQTSVKFVASSFMNTYSAEWAARFASIADEMTMGVWFKAPSAGWYTDSVSKVLCQFEADSDNVRSFDMISNFFTARNISGGTDKKQPFSNGTPDTGSDMGGNAMGWNQLVITISKSQDRAWFMLNGSTVIDQYTDGLGTWVGALGTARAVVGALNNLGQEASLCDQAHFFIASRALSMTEVAQISNPHNTVLRNILVVGDSTSENAQSWPLYFINQVMDNSSIRVAKLPKMHAHAGWTTDDAANGNGLKDQCTGIDDFLATYPEAPNVVIFNLGKNDYSTGPNNPGAIWKTNTLYLIDKIHAAYPNVPIYLTKVWEADRGDGVIPICIAAMNTYIDEILADPNYSFVYMGLNEANFLENGDNGATYYYDTPAVHPNAAGNTLWATNMRALLGW